MIPSLPVSQGQIAEAVLRRTHSRVWNLHVEVNPEKIILRGETDSFYAKQLAQQGVRDLLPDVRLENAIAVA
jgi:hypothetical protein